MDGLVRQAVLKEVNHPGPGHGTIKIELNSARGLEKQRDWKKQGD